MSRRSGFTNGRGRKSQAAAVAGGRTDGLDRIRILVVDDHVWLRAGLVAHLEREPDFGVVGEAGSGEKAISMTRALRPDVVVMDLTMPGMGGLEATRAITREIPGSKVLILTMDAQEDCLTAILEAGASGYVSKWGMDRDLAPAIRSITAPAGALGGGTGAASS
ncbi:MAG: response regulator transcription factor [Gemmatimonadetes bacterium]|nr:response regulator transcription factor [Gemmatimonadota bacterium]